MYYGHTCTADSAFIVMGLVDSNTGTTHSGSYAIVDDLSLTPAGINEISNNIALEKAYPNPASNICNIVYSIPSSANVSVSLYDISGRQVQNLLTDTQLPRGRYKIPVDVTGLNSGIYIYRVVVNDEAYSQKLTVAKN